MSDVEAPDPADHELTVRQQRIIEFFNDYVRRNGYGPTYREIARGVGLSSTSSVGYQLAELESKGYLSRGGGHRSRTVILRMSALGNKRIPVPLVGQIAAGKGILAEQLVEETIPLPKRLVGEGKHILLRVAGDSMIDAAIADGDLVVVRLESDVENGDIVAAMLDTDTSDAPEATIKTLKRIDGHVWLIPHNPAFEPRMADDAVILGKVVTVLRQL
jgi:repressor LexA